MIVADTPEKFAVNVVELPSLMVVLAAVNDAIVAGGTVVVVVGAALVVVVGAAVVEVVGGVVVVLLGTLEVETGTVVEGAVVEVIPTDAKVVVTESSMFGS